MTRRGAAGGAAAGRQAGRPALGASAGVHGGTPRPQRGVNPPEDSAPALLGPHKASGPGSPPRRPRPGCRRNKERGSGP